MRLFVSTLAVSAAVSALAQPVLAREHVRYHDGSLAVSSYRGAAAARGNDGSSAGWRDDAGMTRLAVDGRFGSSEARYGSSYIGQARPRASWRFDSSPSWSSEARENHGELDTMIARHAQENGLPESLVHRVVIRESRYDARAVGAGGAMGLMQIKYSTAREMGYTGTPAGLLDAETNLTYATRYLAGAYRVAGGNPDGAVANYARGYNAGPQREGGSRYQAQAWSGSYASARSSGRAASRGYDRWRDNR